MITTFSHIYHRMRDIDESIEFYTKNLGFKLLRKYSIDDAPAAYINLGDVLLELSVVKNPADLPQNERKMGFTTTDVDADVERLRKNGVEIVEDGREARTFWGRQAAIKDPSGYVITLREWRAPDNPRFDGWQPTQEEVKRVL